MLQRFYINLPADLNEKIENKARATKKTKAEIAREALEIGLKQIEPAKSKSAKALLDLSQMAEKIPTQGKIPNDAIKNMDFYTWGGKKRE